MAAEFDEAVADVIGGVPAGEIVSYGWVATEAGYPGRARAVGRFLAEYDGELPWWRVVRSDGRLVSPYRDEQARRLQAEGVQVKDGRVPRPGR